MENKNANQYKPMYDKMGISIDKLGCIMLDLDGDNIPNLFLQKELYFAANPERYWIRGFIAGNNPHVTLLYGLMESGNTVYRPYVDEILNGWHCDSVKIDHVSYFDSPFPDEPYYCIIAHIKVDDTLAEANQSLKFLPHIDTYPEYKPHVTIAYIKKDDGLRDAAIKQYNEFFKNTILLSKGLNYGR